MKKFGVITMLCINGFPTNEIWAASIEDQEKWEPTSESEIATLKQKEKQQYRICALKNSAKTKIKCYNKSKGNDN